MVGIIALQEHITIVTIVCIGNPYQKTFDLVIDATAPTATINLSDTALAAGETSVVTITFSEAVTAFNSDDDVVVENGTLSLMTSADGGITWTGTFTPSTDIEDASNLISLGNAYTDLLGNQGTVSVSGNYVIDTAAPLAPTAAPQVPENTAGGINAAEAADGTDVSADLTGTGAVAGDTVRIHWGIQSVDYTLTATDISNGNATVTIPNATLTTQGDGSFNVSSQIIDQAGNVGALSPVTTVTVDTQAPTATINLSDTVLAAGETSVVTITFSEAVTAFNSDDDVTVQNGTLSLMTSADGGITWTGTFTPTVGVENATNLISLADTYTDLLGNQGTVSVSANYIIDITPPAQPAAPLSYADNVGAIQSGSTVVAITDDDTPGINIGAGITDTPLLYVDGVEVASVYDSVTGTLTPTSPLASGTRSCRCRFRDAAGNLSALSDAIIIEVDAAAPLAALSAPEVPENSGGGINAMEAADGTIVSADLTGTGAVAGDALRIHWGSQTVDHILAAADILAGSVDVTVPNATLVAEGDGSISVSSRVIDQVGNLGAMSPSTSVTIDTVAVVPTALDLAAADDNGSSNTDNITSNTNNLTISGTAEAGGTVQLFDDVNNDGVIDVGELKAIGTSVQFATGLDISLTTAGIHHIKAVVTNAAGNTSAASAALDITISPALGFAIVGEAGGDWSGRSVSNAGDINGDGLADLIIGANLNDAGGSSAGRSYVVFGKLDGTAVSLTNIAAGIGGFAITGEMANDESGYSVSNAGDVNGDGLSDLIVGALHNDLGGGDAGRSYVIFGKADGTEVSLATLGASAGGFAITGEAAGDQSGKVSAAGDVNGDGLADLIVGAPQNDAGGGDAGRSYVVFGKVDSSAVSLAMVAAGAGGFAMTGEVGVSFEFSGASVSAAGDVNGDGLADLIVGAPYNDAGGGDAGRSYVVFGKVDGSAVSLAMVAAGAGGFAISGEAASDYSGVSVSTAGDINGDGLADLIVGANLNDVGGSSAGRSYVVFGKLDGTAVSLTNIAAGVGGFAITGEGAFDYSGSSVSAAGDVNGDGLVDLIVGAYGNDAGGNAAGRSYVIFGKADYTGVSNVNLSNIASGIGGFVITGEAALDFSGASVSAAGDVNGDGLADLIVGAYDNDAGRSYVIFGKTDMAEVKLADVAAGGGAAHSISYNGTTGADTWTGTTSSEIALGGQGDDTLTGNGGADVLYGGEGNDILIINADNTSKLSLGVTDGLLSRIDGGGDIDTLKLDGSGVILDLTTIANTAVGNPETGSRISSLEKIDITGTGNNTLNIGVADVLDMSGMNLFNSGNGWSGLAASVNKHQVVVDGDAGDALNMSGGWTDTGTSATYGGSTYQIYNSTSSAAQLLVDTDVARAIL